MKQKIISLFSRIVMIVAIVYAVTPCHGKYYEPKLPDKLLKWKKERLYYEEKNDSICNDLYKYF